ncbi:hypothetical protein MLD38_030032 [Melastoma candidum]|uniref:Uncharacterized protein n=1 Tax=Melastoma candidum TaxID=119954 RepID=A0ACB9MK36_9MYRT|nr:hypothetical protein MLD38_030032 [Melastoma candidum]
MGKAGEGNAATLAKTGLNTQNRERGSCVGRRANVKRRRCERGKEKGDKPFFSGLKGEEEEKVRTTSDFRTDQSVDLVWLGGDDGWRMRNSERERIGRIPSKNKQ